LNELQGALGLAQLRKLDTIIGEQRKNKAAVRGALGEVPGIRFRAIPDPDGDTATFIAFGLPSAAETKTFQKAMSAGGVDFVYFYENFWHSLPTREHFIANCTSCYANYPFADRLQGQGRLRARALSEGRVDPVADAGRWHPVKMPAGRVEQIADAAQKASKAL
jgi:8-amino-3,8-dideoxy-alpha-D-manno-octulosonate transaminase